MTSLCPYDSRVTMNIANINDEFIYKSQNIIKFFLVFKNITILSTNIDHSYMFYSV